MKIPQLYWGIIIREEKFKENPCMYNRGVFYFTIISSRKGRLICFEIRI
jgi:hypothetical protein